MKLTFVIWIKEKFTYWCFPFEQENEASDLAQDKSYKVVKGNTGGESGHKATTAVVTETTDGHSRDKAITTVDEAIFLFYVNAPSGDRRKTHLPTVDVEGGEHGQSGDQVTSAVAVEDAEPIAIDATAFHIGNITEIVFETLPSFTLNMINMRLLARDGIASVEWSGVLSACVSIYMILRQGYKYSFWFAYKRMSLNDLPIPGTENTTQSNALAAASGTSAVATAANAMRSALQ